MHIKNDVDTFFTQLQIYNFIGKVDPWKFKILGDF
jgi:hypothetical protein